MKTLRMITALTIIATTFILTSCENKDSLNHDLTIARQEFEADSIKVADSIAKDKPAKMRLIKEITDQIFGYIELGATKVISKSKTDKLVKPLIAKSDSLRKTLSPEQIIEIDAYFQKRGNEAVDYVVKYNRLHKNK